jgi:hypothetical protein
LHFPKNQNDKPEDETNPNNGFDPNSDKNTSRQINVDSNVFVQTASPLQGENSTPKNENTKLNETKDSTRQPNDRPLLIFKNDDVNANFSVREINLEEKCKIGRKKKVNTESKNNMLFDIDSENLSYEHAYLYYDHFNKQVEI